MSNHSEHPTPTGLARLRRITSGGRFIPEIDGFRLLAILIVLIDHVRLQVALANGISWPAFLTLPDGGRRGVYLFFTISGFILGLPFARRALIDAPISERPPFSYRAYLMRRLTRLEPPYVITLVLRFVLILAALHEGGRSLLPHFAASLFYLHNLIFGSMSPISPPTWSLEVEVQFYLLAPLLGTVFWISPAAWRRTFLAAVTICGSVIAPLFFSGKPRLELSLAGNFQYFTAGLLLCDLYLTHPYRDIPKYFWDLLGIGTLALLLWNSSLLTTMLFPFGSLIVYMAGFQGQLVRRFFAASFVSIAGGMCYSIYLTHGTVLAIVGKMVPHMGVAALPAVGSLVLVLAASLSAALLVGALFFIALERPCMDPRWPYKLAEAFRRGWLRHPSHPRA
jgi:peptidoglycan/LPS O-acetylase OafA/YrhL